ncbi:MAG: type II secretion system protein [Sedimentisphaerales bacterium]|nr:type II secretion system protein [Sedimentisphaerales bacterium]
MRKGLTLIELLVLITILPIVMLVLSRIFATFLRDIPREARLMEQNVPLRDMTRNLALDVDRAEGLPDSAGSLHADEFTLLIELPEGVACYQWQDGAVTRTLRPDNGQEDSVVERSWEFPDAVVQWQRRWRNERACAVELRTRLRHRVEGKMVEKLANSHVYFVNALGKAREIR